jgi:hypothetical protein
MSQTLDLDLAQNDLANINPDQYWGLLVPFNPNKRVEFLTRPELCFQYILDCDKLQVNRKDHTDDPNKRHRYPKIFISVQPGSPAISVSLLQHLVHFC